MEYGYINESGYLKSLIIDDSYSENQINDLIKKGWKPVDEIDDLKFTKDVIRILPYDNEDRISYHYIKGFDFQKAKKEIKELKQQLLDSDYKIIKAYEMSLVNTRAVVDISDLHEERQEMRDKINKLEELIINNKNII